MARPCAKRDELFAKWTTASNTLRDLEALKNSAIRDADPNCSRWDAEIQEAQTADGLAMREYERHLVMHGCGQ
jgi:hypothetical protein